MRSNIWPPILFYLSSNLTVVEGVCACVHVCRCMHMIHTYLICVKCIITFYIHHTDPVSFFNLRLTSDSSFSLDLEQTSSQLTQQISSAITDMCQCVLPDYTLRGTMELCDDQQSNCAVYTGRILSSDMATASELFEQVEVWLSA